AQVRIVSHEDGAALEVTRTLHCSPMKQIILLAHDGRRLDFITEIDWQERHKLLKIAFPVDTYATEAVHEIQFGHVTRPTHRSRQADRDQYEVCNHRYTALWDGAQGAAVLNDSKYGVSTQGSEIRLTLLRAPLMPDMTADRGLQRFTYSFCPLTALEDALREAAILNEPPRPMAGSSIPVLLPDAGNIIVDTIKPADDREDAIVARVYESMGRATRTKLTLAPGLRELLEADMLEENCRPVSPDEVAFGPFEIKTFILPLKEE
ncbi:MAG: alpha-mannosidase, partial [Clostridia bacterium]|nr:alpha-mannosidase [Clostridia bacterium]